MPKSLITVAVLLTSAATTAPAAATSAGGHCPPENSGYVVWNVGGTEPYAADNATDERGNGNGVVCAQPKKLVLDENGQLFQMYQFIDDTGAAR